MYQLERIADIGITDLKENNLFRQLNETARDDGVHITRNGKKIVSFSCNDYLGLSQNEDVKAEAIIAIERYGTGSGASRFITGNNPLYTELETKLSKMKGTEDAIVFGSGYLANLGTIPALVGKGDLIVADRLVHACIIDGAKLSGAKMLRFAHNSLEKCEDILKNHRRKYRHCLIVTDHVFSMDGDIAPVSGLYKLAEKYDAFLMTDDAHGLGIVPAQKAHIQMGTLSKAVGGYGGYVCASKNIIEYLRNKSRSLIYSTALPPSVLAGAIAALDIIANNHKLGAIALENAQYFTKQLGLPLAQSTIVALILGDEEKAVTAAKILEEEGFLVSAIRPPTVPKGTARLRFTFSSLHNRQNIDKMVAVVKQRLI